MSFEKPEEKNENSIEGTVEEKEGEYQMRSPEYFDAGSNSYITKEEHEKKIKEKLEDPFGDASK